MRGDPPESIYDALACLESTPHARGSTFYTKGLQDSVSVYPACAGIHPKQAAYSGKGGSLPRMRGDPPHSDKSAVDILESTPHARGSTPRKERTRNGTKVYPACAGIHRKDSLLESILRRLPRMRGDPPVWYVSMLGLKLSTPHARGSTLDSGLREAKYRVYPACAGIHPRWVALACPHGRLPRMRGDPP